MSVSKSAIISAALLALAACGRSDNSNVTANASTDEAGSLADATNPFADAEAKMSNAMMAAVGSDAGQSWAKKMIAHHQGAIDMSEVVLGQNPKADVAEMAHMTIEKQKKDIADIEKLVKDGAPDQRSADLYRSAMMEMKQKMDAATGADVNELFMRKMLEHHRGAVAMSDVALQNGVSGAMRQQVQKTRMANEKDAKMVEAMLNGQTMQQAIAQSGTKSAAEAKAEPAPADKAASTGKGMPVPGTKTKEKMAHDMNSMGNMDMNKM